MENIQCYTELVETIVIRNVLCAAELPKNLPSGCSQIDRSGPKLEIQSGGTCVHS